MSLALSSEGRSQGGGRQILDLDNCITVEKPRLKAIFWDCDNTLLKTETPALTECHGVLKEAVEEWSNGHLTFAVSREEFVKGHQGGAYRDMLRQYLDAHDSFGVVARAEELNSFIDKWSRREQEAVIRAFAQNGVEPTTGTIEFLQEHQQLGLEAIVVSSSADHRLAVSIQAGGMVEYFDDSRIFSAQNAEFMERGGRRKPAPDVYLHALEASDLKADEVIAIEDSKSGVLSAMRAGIDVVYFVGVDGTSPSKEEVRNMLAAIERTLKETRPPKEDWPAGRVIGVTDDSSKLSAMVSSLRSGSLYNPWMCHSNEDSAHDVDLGGSSFSGS